MHGMNMRTFGSTTLAMLTPFVVACEFRERWRKSSSKATRTAMKITISQRLLSGRTGFRQWRPQIPHIQILRCARPRFMLKESAHPFFHRHRISYDRR
jgi:hypothetical protein